jgi:transposase
MKKTSTVRVNRNMIFKGHKLTIGLDLGDRWSFYCILDEAGEVLLEQKLATTPEAMKDLCDQVVSLFLLPPKHGFTYRPNWQT